MQTLLFASLATVAASSAHVTPHEKINQHVALVYKLNGTEHVKQSDAFTTKGSMVRVFYLINVVDITQFSMAAMKYVLYYLVCEIF